MQVRTSGYMYLSTFWGGNPPVVDQGVGCPHVQLGVKGEGLKKMQAVGGCLTAGGKPFLLCERGTGVALLTKAATAPWCSSHGRASMPHMKSFPKLRSLEGAHHH